MYTEKETNMLNNLFSVATDEELESSFYEVNKKPHFEEKEAVESIIVNEIKERVAKEVLRERVMEAEYYGGA